MLTKRICLWWYRKIITAALLLTPVIIVAHFYLPAKRINLIPSENPFYSKTLYGFSEPNGQQSANWLDATTNHWACLYKPEHSYGCGWDLSLNSKPDIGMDWRNYTGLEISLRYSGDASRIRVFVRNFNAAYAQPEDWSSYKIMNMSFPVTETKHPVLIDLKEFAVAAWWIEKDKNRLRWPLPEFSNITHIGVDLAEPGKHDIQIESITLMGKWFHTRTLLFWIISCWMCIFLFEGTFRFFKLHRRTKGDNQLIKMLEGRQRELTEENQQLENLANFDPLTGIYNRTGMQLKIEALAQQEDLTGVGVMILDLDHFKQLNDHYGHDMGDTVLRTFAATLSSNMRREDIFSRQGGEEFVVICRRQPVENVYTFAEKLRKLAQQCTFETEPAIHLTISIGVALINSSEPFPDTLKRADNALYRAKNGGRNCVQFDSTQR